MTGGWHDATRQLTQLQACADAAHQAALDSIGSGTADAFVLSLSELGRSLSQAQSVLADPGRAASPLPTELSLQIEQLRISLDNLYSLNSRLSAQSQRALAVLFPPDPINSYSRLGGRSMGPTGAGRGYLKA